MCALAGGLMLTALASAVPAQAYPDRPIRIIAPFPAGGLVDVLARAVGEEMAKSLGQPVIVENKPGAGGNLGAAMVANAAPDGYTLMMTSPGIQSINQFLYKEMPYDAAKAFAPISLVADMPMLVIVNPKTGFKTLKDLIAAAKANPDKLNFGSAGVGTTGHLGQALFVYAADIKVKHVPYRGAAPAVNDLIGGHLDGVVDNPPIVMAHIKSGTLTALAVGGPTRLAALPDVPTAAEAGLPAWQASSWFGLVAPAGTSPEIIKRLQAEVAKALKQPSMQRFVGESGMTLISNSPEAFETLIVAERKKWGDIIKAAKIEAN
ncbi:tripartite tricarboxylate transporter substrate binding protein [Pseudolabrys taiwanensis]|uniref:Tripartite tricarboxylate transporter substrate binding protein n=2 Tax=Pseudolabrys taiwanensis TaxID=331696 RepID=A0A346A305_9HYPH|nr:tripartite tricarboxylate transporter substrate binding protein [Pseudolabrys taiwanensis]